VAGSSSNEPSGSIKCGEFNDLEPVCFSGRYLFRVVSYRGADKSLARPTSQCILFDSENISFDASLVIYMYI
jgi:hypothetical protein